MMKWPCPCCGFRTLDEGPGDYWLCDVCIWEDDPGALRWPRLDDGPNAIPLLDAQRNYAAFGACDLDARDRVREPRVDEPRDPGWRRLDPEVDEFERSPHDPGDVPWPEDLEALYWWRPTYYRLAANRTRVPVPRRPATNAAERLMARILDTVPEAEPIDVELRHRYEAPAPFAFCSELAKFVLDAYARGDVDLAVRTVAVLNTGLTEDAGEAANCVVIAFLERDEWHDQTLSAFIDTWPPEVRQEVKRQIAHVTARAHP
ncbi:MAG: DUF7674 family protein [Frankiaceae bacterium]